MQIEHPLRESNNTSHFDGISSLSQILTQALESNDVETLKFVIQQEDLNVINKTLDEFDKEQFYPKFIEILSIRLKSFPNEITNSLRWLDVLLKKKSLYFRKHPNSLNELKNSRDVLEVKERMYSSLLRIKGKLSFIIEAKKSVHDPDANVTGQFGIPRIIVDERENDEIDNTKNKRKGDEIPNEFDEEVPEEMMEDINDKEEDLMYEEDYENDGDIYDEEEDENGKKVEEELGMELEEEIKAEDKKQKYLKLKNQSKKEKPKNRK